ncbi:MAG: ketopantoate reductase family protein [Clostridiaceae bacterium]|nr:ketopantoate reductase family protein [Bacillota bacterium]NLI38712.1 ketopantoate reductase family protein [Clostridiaceae bacterium]
MAKTIRKAHISGLGAVGSVYASILYGYDRESVKVIVDAERASRYQAQGVTVNGKKYDFDYVISQTPAEPADLILIAVKGNQLEESIESIRPFVGENTILMSLLNGISSEDILAGEFGDAHILHAFVVGTDAIREGLDTRYGNKGKIVFGHRYQADSADVQAVKAFFDRTGVPYSNPSDIMKEQWWKFLMNVGINQTSAILRAPYKVYHSVQEIRDLMMSAAREVIPIAQKEGINLNEEDIANFLEIIDTLSPDGKTSMLQDVEAGRKTEVELFAQTVIQLGQKHGIPTPVNEVLFRMIRTIEQSYPTQS